MRERRSTSSIHCSLLSFVLDVDVLTPGTRATSLSSHRTHYPRYHFTTNRIYCLRFRYRTHAHHNNACFFFFRCTFGIRTPSNTLAIPCPSQGLMQSFSIFTYVRTLVRRCNIYHKAVSHARSSSPLLSWIWAFAILSSRGRNLEHKRFARD